MQQVSEELSLPFQGSSTEISVRIRNYWLRNSPEQRSSHLRFSQFETEFDAKRVAQDPSFFNLKKKIAKGTKHTLIQARLAR